MSAPFPSAFKGAREWERLASRTHSFLCTECRRKRRLDTGGKGGAPKNKASHTASDPHLFDLPRVELVESAFLPNCYAQRSLLIQPRTCRLL